MNWAWATLRTGIPDDQDNCPDVSNDDQLNTDSDGMGNAYDPDDDNDEMPDDWENQYGLNPLIDDASEDPDSDGYTNLQEYRAGSDPGDPDDHPQPPPMPWLPLLLGE